MLVFKKYLKEGFTAVTALGTAYFYTIIILFLFLTNNQKTALHLVVGLLICYTFVFIVRVFHFKERPEKEQHFNFITKLSASSFPSLHTMTVIYTVTVLSKLIQVKGIITLLFLLALLVSYSRIYLKKHYYVDVVIGLILGVIASLIYIMLT